LIITDHHIASKLPNAFCIINPKQPLCTFPFKEICGAQIAWYLVAGLKNKLKINYDMNKILDILVLAIIADVMPLVSMNRALVKKALRFFSISQRPAILAIKEVLQKNTITSEDIGFVIAPKINVAGRLEDAILAVEFLKSKDIINARETFAYLSELNIQRKQIQEEAFIKSYNLQKDLSTDVIISVDESFNAGVIGIVASKLVDKCKKVALVGALDTNTGMIKMSGRSYAGVNLYDLLDSCKENLTSFGGHKEAAGLNIHISKLDIFKKQINYVFKNNFSFKEIDDVFGILDINDVDYELLSILNKYEPFGHKNERPIFLIKDIKIAKADKIGKDKKTLKIAIEQKNEFISAIKFDDNSDIEILENENIKVDIKASISENIFRGNSSIQLMIKEILYNE
jgi:single-stranded-DNA-specific exonuclease